MRLLGLVITIFSACVLLLTSAGPAAAATDVSCGQQIREPGLYTFSQDLVCGENEDIRIWTGDVTVDMQGHTLTANNVTGAFNIYAFGAQPPVVIKNGTIRGVAAGSLTAGVLIVAGSIVLHDLMITENRHGVFLWDMGSVRVEDSLISLNGTGVRATAGSDATVENNRIVNNGVGVHVWQAGGSISNNFIARNETGILHDNGPEVTDNFLINNRGNGMTMVGTEFYAPRFTVTGNFAFGNGGYGIWSLFPVGISSGNRAAGNGSTPQCWNVVCSLSGK